MGPLAFLGPDTFLKAVSSQVKAAKQSQLRGGQPIPLHRPPYHPHRHSGCTQTKKDISPGLILLFGSLSSLLSFMFCLFSLLCF